MVSVSSSPKQVDGPGSIQAFAQLCRPTLSVLAALASCLTIYALNPESPARFYLLTAFVLFCMTAAAFAINDFDDIEKDRINHPERPIPSGTLAPQQAWWIAVVLFTGAVLAAILLGICPLILVVACTLLLWHYSALLQVNGILGNMVVSSIVATLIFLASLVAGRPLAMLYPSGFLFGHILTKEIIWDIHDAVGDRNRNVYTIANTWGAGSAFRIAWGLLGVLLVSVPVAIATLPMTHPLLFSLGALIMLLSLSFALVRYQQQQTSFHYNGLIIWGRLGMFLGLIGLLGTAPPL